VFTNLKTGESRTLGYQYGSLNHLQFSPTDPNLLMYCHEGTWHEVDRIWTIRTDGSGNTLRHKRTMDMEIAGHEFWSHDGRTIWFDLQTPRSQVFWIAGVDVASGKRTRYRIDRDAWSVHYNVTGRGGVEPNGSITPDKRWVIFTGNFHGERHVYAVEVAKSR
jgi:oligogalacturonide lyase